MHALTETDLVVGVSEVTHTANTMIADRIAGHGGCAIPIQSQAADTACVRTCAAIPVQRGALETIEGPAVSPCTCMIAYQYHQDWHLCLMQGDCCSLVAVDITPDTVMLMR